MNYKNGENDALAIVDFYEGVDGPTLRIDIQQNSDMIALISAITDMTQCMYSDFYLHEKIKLSYKSLKCLHFWLNNEIYNGNQIFESCSETNNLRFEWIATSEEWLTTIEKLKVFLDSREPGHQYFDDSVGSGITIEIAYREERPSG
jgi:hypothetical protein